MVRIQQLKMSIEHTEDELLHKAAALLRIKPSDIVELLPIKRSLDARKKDDIHYSYCLDVKLRGKELEKKLLSRRQTGIVLAPERRGYAPRITGTQTLKNRPVIIGSGPAGLFCCYELAKAGYAPILLERGGAVEERIEAVRRFHTTGQLSLDTNVQFGEGGAGTFSDGKLNTMVKETTGRIPHILETFASFGAKSEITYVNKPHIGTDILRDVIKNMRKELLRLGAEIRFHAQVTELCIENGALQGVLVGEERIPCDICVLAIGHSARDTFAMLKRHGIHMEPKAFAVGVRIEHKQAIINESQYGKAACKLPPADYKLTYTTTKGRSVYSFCMCPGGYVVNASSEMGRLTVNGMSYHDRAGENANSALIVNVNPEDYYTKENGVLSGVAFQQRLEEAAYLQGNGKVPIQLYGDLQNHRPSVTIGAIIPNTKGGYHLTSIEPCLPAFVTEALLEGIPALEQKLHGFANEEAVLSGVEARTSSPVRIVRNEELCANVAGLYPCGEGAGYAGGITSAAMDGLRVYEQIIQKYRPFEGERL